MYSEKLVTVVKHNGRVLRETGGSVHIPFGSEYTLLFKNLNSVRALVRVSVDGQDATKGTSLIVPANSSIELERFLEAGQMDKGYRFKFIERTKKIEDGPRGIGAEDGLIRVEFEFEREPDKIVRTIKEEIVHRHVWNDWPRYTLWNGSPIIGNATLTSTAALGTATYSANSPTTAGATGTTLVAQAHNASASTSALNAFAGGYDPTAQIGDYLNQAKVEAVNDVGITVKGGVSEQKFTTGAWFPTDGQKHVMVLKLLGFVGEKRVEKPITVKTQQECPTCGTKNKHGTKFCRECGTGLALI